MKLYLIQATGHSNTLAMGEAEAQEIVSRKLDNGASVCVWYISTGQNVTSDFV